MAEFIVRENYLQHGASLNLENYLQKVDHLLKEDVSVFETSLFWAAFKNSEMVGAVKTTCWDETLTLPIQTLFNINPAEIKNKEANSIWHVGRFAIAKSEKEGAQLLKKLIAFAIYPICLVPNSIMLAECDSKFLKVLNMIGIRTEVLAPSIDYLGSETIPICSTQRWLYEFLVKSTYYQDAKYLYNISKFRKDVIYSVENKLA